MVIYRPGYCYDVLCLNIDKYQMNPDIKIMMYYVIDIDECEDSNICFCDDDAKAANCTAKCVNKLGGYFCECFKNRNVTHSFEQKIKNNGPPYCTGEWLCLNFIRIVQVNCCVYISSVLYR